VLHRPKKSRTSKFRPSSLPKIGPGKIGNWIKFTAFSGPVSPDRYEGALDEINKWRERNKLPPLAGEHLEECERDVISAVRSVEYFKQYAPFVMTPKNYERIVKADAEKLREVALHGYGISGELLDLAAMLDSRAAVKQPRISARERAVDLAEQLLTRFVGSAPGQTVNGPWHHLSAILFGKPGADMFEAIRRSRRASRP
jgi:hypothetical protein